MGYDREWKGDVHVYVCMLMIDHSKDMGVKGLGLW